MHHIFVLLFFCCPFCEAAAQKIPDSTSQALVGCWTNGFQFYSGKKVNDQLVSFSGGTLHEGAFNFIVAAHDDGTLYIAGGKFEEDSSGQYREDSNYEPAFGKRGDKIILKLIAGHIVLILPTPDGGIRDFLISEPMNFDLDTLVRSNRTKYQLAGKYQDSATRRVIIFWPDKPSAENLTTTDQYDFGTEYDFPTDILIFKNSKAFYYDHWEGHLDLFKANGNGDDEYEKGRKLMSLRQIKWFNVTGDTSLHGKYAYASSVILTDDIFEFLDPFEIRRLRNEIYARHGYIFKTPDMKFYFAAQPWYQPRFDNVDDQLTDLEKFNLLLIRKLPASSNN
ncbi:MAG TPA: YARHG domain-containing protein [Puia sp.]|jgi:hypothetical protein|nr:YARHG domain-containing protein [Puia sp.]